jgi:myo-inositol-1(or 4)-monophosphatase
MRVADLDDFARVAHAAVDAACARLRVAAGERPRVEYKSAIDLVTETDREIERLVGDRVRGAFPAHVVIGEEACAGARPPRPDSGQYAWYLDPIDGTTNFAHGHPHFAVSLALARGAELLLGVVADPLRGERFAAVRGRGATLNGAPIHVSTTPALDQALLATGTPYDRRERADFYLGFIKALMLRAHGIRRAGSAALDLCYVACGRFDAYWEWRLAPWDHAAGALIVAEAGGMVTATSGTAFDVFGASTLASNGLLHAAMVEVLAEPPPPPRGPVDKLPGADRA